MSSIIIEPSYPKIVLFIQFLAKDIAKVTRGLVQIPMVGSKIAFGYNYDCDLKLTQQQAVQVAMGGMIKKQNEVGCKPGKLTWAHRSDSSGTTKAN